MKKIVFFVLLATIFTSSCGKAFVNKFYITYKMSVKKLGDRPSFVHDFFAFRKNDMVCFTNPYETNFGYTYKIWGVDINTQKIVWEGEADSNKIYDGVLENSVEPLFFGKNGLLSKFDINSGKTKWELDKQLDILFYNKDTVICNDGSILAVDANNGEEIWSHPSSFEDLLISNKEDYCIQIKNENTIVLIDKINGKIIKTVQYDKLVTCGGYNRYTALLFVKDDKCRYLKGSDTKDCFDFSSMIADDTRSFILNDKLYIYLENLKEIDQYDIYTGKLNYRLTNINPDYIIQSEINGLHTWDLDRKAKGINLQHMFYDLDTGKLKSTFVTYDTSGITEQYKIIGNHIVFVSRMNEIAIYAFPSGEIAQSLLFENDIVRMYKIDDDVFAVLTEDGLMNFVQLK